MLSAKGIRNACPRCNSIYLISWRHNVRYETPFSPFGVSRTSQSSANRVTVRPFSASRRLRQEDIATSPASSKKDIEKVVRDAKQRFRDTLPKGYLNAEEYALYERLYGPPLRETVPDDVGIPTHSDMGAAEERPENEGVLLRELESGEFEEVSYEIAREVAEAVQTDDVEVDPDDADAVDLVDMPPGYVETVARSERERAALQVLQKDYEASRANQQEEDDGAALHEEESERDETATTWPEERAREAEELAPKAEAKSSPRFHPYSLEGRFHGTPVEVMLPHDELVMPIRELLERTHLDHVKKAAEDAFGGVGLPTSPATPDYKKNSPMVKVGLPPDERHMTEIEADAFLAAYMPPAYASAVSILGEVRKREGSEWLRPRLKDGRGLSVLDAGMGGAGLIAWEQVLNAEWEALRDRGEVLDKHPPMGKKSVVVGSDRLRHRTKNFLHNTSFLPRLPDYVHSGATQGSEHLDSGDRPQARKSYDVVIASHLFLKENKNHEREALLNNLWSLVNKDGGILIVIEKAHPRGFEAMAHVRDTVLREFLLPNSGSPILEPDGTNPVPQREREPGHVMAPCTNQTACPMYTTPGKSSGRKDYCHFSQRFVRPMFHSKLFGDGASPQGEVEFSYVAIRRGVAKESEMSGKEATTKAFEGYEKSESVPDMQTLPRLLRPALKRKGHVTMDMCTAEGKVERWTMPKSFSQLGYHDARKARWGDLWALGAKTRVPGNVRAGSGFDKEEQLKRAKKDAKRQSRQSQRQAFQQDARPKQAKGKKAKAERLAQQAMEAEQMEEDLVERQIDEDLEEETEQERGR